MIYFIDGMKHKSHIFDCAAQRERRYVTSLFLMIYLNEIYSHQSRNPSRSLIKSHAWWKISVYTFLLQTKTYISAHITAWTANLNGFSDIVGPCSVL